MLTKVELAHLEQTLRAEGFPRAVSDRAALYEVLAHHADQYRSPHRLERAGRLIGPIICSTPEEQRRFTEVFSRWRQRWERAVYVSVPARPPSAPTPVQPPPLPSRWASIFGCLALVLTVVALSFSVDGLKVSRPLIAGHWTTPDQLEGSATQSPHRGAQIRNSDGTGILRLAALVVPVIVFAAWLHWRLWARRTIKSRFPNAADPGLNRFVGRGDASERLFPARALTVLREFRRTPAVAARGIDVPQSVDATAREGGRAMVVPRSIREERRYVALIETRCASDHAAHLARALVTRMRARELDIDVYFFCGSPESVIAPDGREHWLALDRLSRRYASEGGARVLVFAEPEICIDPLTQSSAPWVDMLAEMHSCVLLPMSPHPTLCEPLARAGWVVVPRSLEGISRLPGMFARGGEARLSDTPPSLDPARWRHCEDAAARSLSTVKRQLDLDTRIWLASLAVYPRLSHDLSLHLGAELGRRAHRGTFDERRLRRVSALEWLRHGAIPAPIRDGLLDSLPVRERRIVRRLLYHALGSALLDKSMAAEVNVRPDKRTRAVVRAFLRTRADGDPLVDRLATQFLLFPRWGRQFVALQDRLARLLGFRVDAVPLPAVLLTIAAVAGCGWVVDMIESHLPAFNGWVTEHRMWVGMAVYVLAVATWSGFWTSVMLSPRFEKFTSELWRRRVRVAPFPVMDRPR